MQTPTRHKLNVFVDKWFAWQPRLDQAAQCTSYVGGRLEQTTMDKPGLENVPAMQRRRLGPLARVVFHVLGQCSDTSKQEPVVFSSYMGEIQRTQGILADIAVNQPVSPAAFSLSVHNAISGQWSLIHGIRAPMIAISPANGSCIPAILEAIGMLRENKYTAINIVLYEEDYPQFYKPYLHGPDAPSALALRLVSAELAGADSLKLSVGAIDDHKKPSQLNGVLDLIPLLKRKQQSIDIAEPQCTWRLEYCR